MNILISGVGGDIGLGVWKILRRWNTFDQLHGIDVRSDHIGRYSVDFFEQSPVATQQRYLSWLENYIKKNSISLFIPTSENEIKTLSESHLTEIGSAKILINSPFVINTFLDKYETMQFLAQNSVVVPANGLLSGERPSKYPVVVKPRYGRGSKGILTINCESDLPTSHDDLVWQEKLEPADQEYTCAIYCSERSKPRTLIMKRTLSGGYTASGEVVCDSNIENYLSKIAKILGNSGAINVQLRKTKKGPLVFEINPRLSSTLVFRDLLGFNDLKWWISDTCSLENLPYVEVPAGIKFYRGVSEHIILPEVDDGPR